MFRGFWHDVTRRGRRFISIGGRHTRGGFSQPLGKHPQVKQGIAEGVPRRIPGTTKVTYTNKKGRTFNFSVPVAEITHPQVELTNSSGNWREIDTSFSDLGDMEDDMPSAVDECLQMSPDATSLRSLYEAFVSFCKEYVLMDTTGMKNMPFYGELNVGPGYEHYDRRLKRKRHWLAIRHRFEDVRYIIWPDDEAEVEELSPDAQLSVRQMLDALRWLETASTFCVRKMHPADMTNEEEFLPLDLHREVAVVARRARNDATLFSSLSTESDLFVECATLCLNHKVPFHLFFAAGDHNGAKGVTVGDGSCILVNMPFVHTTLGAIRIMSVIGGDSTAYAFSNLAGGVERWDVLEGLSRLMSVEAFGEKDALENVGEDEICIIMRFCVEVREKNAAFFSCDSAENVEEVSFRAKYRQVSHLALSRCKYLLYRLDGPRTRVMSEGGYVPLVELQKHAERTNKDTLVYYNLGIRSAQGLRRVTLGAQSSAQLAELVDRLEAPNAHVNGNTLLVDLVQHLSCKAAASKISLTLKEVNTLLPLLARMRAETATGKLDSRFDRLLNVMETAIGTAMQQNRSVEEIVDLLEGLAACNFVPSSFKQVEMVLMRLMMTRTCRMSHVTRVLTSLSSLFNSEVSQVLLQTAASHAMFCTKTGTISGREVDELVELLEALASCRYAALPGLIAHCREECFSDEVLFSLKQRCGYASLLASAASGMRHQDESFSQQLANDSRHHFIEYIRNREEEKDLACFVDCITGLTTVGFGDAAENEEYYSTLVSFLRSPCLSLERCATMSTMALATLLEGVLLWCTTLRVPPEGVVAPIERTLLARICSFNDPGSTLDSSEELAESVCRLVCLQRASEDLRRAAAQALGKIILHAEAVAEAWIPTAQQDLSFEVVALANAERESKHMNTVLRYCAALQQSAAVPRGYQVVTGGVMDTHRRATLGQPSITSSRFMSLAFANASRMDASIATSFGLHLREPRIKRNHPRKVLCADDCDLMVSLMQKACPTFPPRAQEATGSEEDEQDETESQIYLKNLTRALDEALTRKRKLNMKSRSFPKDTATSWVESSHASTTSAPVEAERGALELWMEEQHRGQRITRSAEPFCKSRSLANAVSKGRFPDDANAPISEAVRKWEKEQSQPLQRHRHLPKQQRKSGEGGKDQDEKTHREISLSSHEGLNGAPTLLGRLKQLPMRSWRMIHNLTRAPEPPVKNDSMPADERPVDFMVVENWRHNFDYVGYEEQFNLDGLLSTRDFCRCMVTRHEASTTGQTPLIALADMFKKNRARSAAKKREAQPCPNKDVLWSSVWMQRANEIALEKERQKLIDGIRAFELRVPAAARSKEAVEELQKDLVELLKKWPCDSMKRHVFTKINFVEWVRERQKLQPTVGKGALPPLSLAESMASRAEASFVEHVLALLPGDENSIVTRRPATAP